LLKLFSAGLLTCDGVLRLHHETAATSCGGDNAGSGCEANFNAGCAQADQTAHRITKKKATGKIRWLFIVNIKNCAFLSRYIGRHSQSMRTGFGAQKRTRTSTMLLAST
jgi:hypothetical protein